MHDEDVLGCCPVSDPLSLMYSSFTHGWTDVNRLEQKRLNFFKWAGVRGRRQGVLWWRFWCKNRRELGVLWAVTHLDAGASSPRCEIYEVSNGNSDIYGIPSHMMEGECSI